MSKEFKRNNIPTIEIDNFGYPIPEEHKLTGSAGAFSWRRLEEILRAAGELRSSECVKGYRVDHFGVSFFVEDIG